MRTVFGWARRVQVLARRRTQDVVPVAAVRPLAAGRHPLLSGRVGAQRRAGVVLDQVDRTTCGSAVLVALSAWADPAELRRLEGPGEHRTAVGGGPAPAARAAFGVRYDARQKQVHRESTRFWPRALGTSPWGMVRWLRENVPSAGPYRVRPVDDTDPGDVRLVVEAVEQALRAGRPVPLLVGSLLPRHYVMATGFDGARWTVYEPTGGELRVVDPAAVGGQALRLGFDRLHVALLPA
jgi:hypothetical protein